MPYDRPLIIAHRGDSFHAPENTLAAFRAARTAGADGIELDVQMTSDGRLICMHDSTLIRTTDASARFPGRSSYEVTQFTLEEIQSLDAGGWFNESFRGEGVPTLEEALDCMTAPPSLHAAIEIKAPAAGMTSPAIQELARAFEAVAERSHDRLLLHSFDPAVLQTLAREMPSITRFQIVPSLSEILPGLFPCLEAALDYALGYAQGLSLPDEDVSRLIVDSAKLRGLDVYVWTVNDAARIRELAAMGVDGIITDDPALASRTLNA